MASRKKDEFPWSGKIHSLRTKLGMNQVRFAKAMRVTQPTVSAWEKGQKDYSPSAETYIQLARLAKDIAPSSAFWFLEQAKVDQPLQHLIPAIRKELRELSGALSEAFSNAGKQVRPIPLIAERDVPSVISSGSLLEGPSAQMLLPVPTFLVPAPARVFAVQAPDSRMYPMFGEGDVVVVDASRIDGLEGKLVVAYHDRDEGRWRAGIHIGWLRYFSSGDRHSAMLQQMETSRELEDHIRTVAGRPEKVIEWEAAPDVIGDSGWRIVGAVMWSIPGSAPYLRAEIQRARGDEG
ncbi:MAG: helix-turn-helix transcriptional regulator [Terriglobales bacterium]